MQILVEIQSNYRFNDKIIILLNGNNGWSSNDNINNYISCVNNINDYVCVLKVETIYLYI